MKWEHRIIEIREGSWSYVAGAIGRAPGMFYVFTYFQSNIKGAYLHGYIDLESITGYQLRKKKEMILEVNLWMKNTKHKRKKFGFLNLCFLTR